MRKASLLMVAALALTSLADAGDQSAKTTLTIGGMTCGGCVAAVKVELEKTEGVTAYEVSLEKGEAEVTYDPAKTEPRKIAESVSQTGFDTKPKDEKEGESAMKGKDLSALVQSAEAVMPGLSPEEQRAGIVLMRELAKGEPVAVPRFAQALGVSVGEAEALVKDSALSRLIYAGGDGRVVGFWGLSTARTPHQLTINGRTMWAWCAGDTLFLPEVLAQTAAVESRDQESGELLRLTISADGIEAVEPKDVTMSFLPVDTVDFTSATRLMATACHHIFFFASRASAERWVAKHRGKLVVLSLNEAFGLARRLNAQVFGTELARLGAGAR